MTPTDDPNEWERAGFLYPLPSHEVMERVRHNLDRAIEELLGPTSEQKAAKFRQALAGGEYRMEIAGLEPLFPVGFTREDDLDMNEIRRAATEFLTSHVEVQLTEEQKDLLLRLWYSEESTQPDDE